MYVCIYLSNQIKVYFRTKHIIGYKKINTRNRDKFKCLYSTN